MVYYLFWLVSVLLAFYGGYRLGWHDAEYVRTVFAGLDRAILSLRSRGFRS